MEFIKYEIQKKDTIISIAKKYKISVSEVVNFHNQHCKMTHQIIGDYIPINVDFVIVNPEILPQNEEKEKFKITNNLQFDKRARYRCEQFNATKVEDNITFHCNTKKEYTLEKDQKNNLAKVNLIEYLYKINPENLSLAIEATKELEFEKENVLFK